MLLKDNFDMVPFVKKKRKEHEQTFFVLFIYFSIKIQGGGCAGTRPAQDSKSKAGRES